MAKEIKYKIGEISKMYGVSIKSLRYYQQINLLTPSIVDKFTHYRYYGAEEMLKLFYIGQLREKGFRLLEIKEMFEEGNFTADIARLEINIQKYEQEIESLKKRLDIIKKIHARKKDREKNEKVYLHTLPSIIVASHIGTFTDYNDFIKQITSVIIPELMRLGCKFPNPYYCFIRENSKGLNTQCIEIEFCDEVTEMKENTEIIQFKRLPKVHLAMCMKVHCPVEKLSEKQMELFAEIAKRGYRIVGDTRFKFSKFGLGLKDFDKSLTIIQVPVEKVLPPVQQRHNHQ